MNMTLSIHTLAMFNGCWGAYFIPCDINAVNSFVVIVIWHEIHEGLGAADLYPFGKFS